MTMVKVILLDQPESFFSGNLLRRSKKWITVHSADNLDMLDGITMIRTSQAKGYKDFFENNPRRNYYDSYELVEADKYKNVSFDDFLYNLRSKLISIETNKGNTYEGQLV